MSDITMRTREGAQSVIVTDISMPFMSMVVFMVKWVIASIPAMIILMILGAILSGILSVILASFGVVIGQ